MPNEIHSKMKNVPLVFLFILSLNLMACKQSADDQIKQITAAEAQLYTGTATELNTDEIKRIIGLYEQFAKDYRENEMTPEYLFRCADLNRALKNFDRSMAIYDEIINDYSAFPKIDLCYFYRAYCANNDLHDTEKARIYYQEFISKFPNEPLAKSAREELMTLGKTPEQLMEEIKAKTDSLH